MKVEVKVERGSSEEGAIVRRHVMGLLYPAT